MPDKLVAILFYQAAKRLRIMAQLWGLKELQTLLSSQATYKFNSKMQAFQRVLDLTSK